MTRILARIWTVICFLLLWLTKVTYLKLFLSDPFPGTYRKPCSIIGCYLQTYPDIVPKLTSLLCLSEFCVRLSLVLRYILSSRSVGMQIRNKNLQRNILNSSITQSSDPAHEICTAISDSISVVRCGYLQYTRQI